MPRILIIDDHETITASNGKDGLEKIIRLVPDVELCDLRMPKMDGFTVLKRMGNILI